MRYNKPILTAILTLLLSTSIFSAIEPIEELSFTVPGLSGPIEQFVFNDIDNDSFPEVLATDGVTLVLYSISKDSVLFTDTIPPTVAPYILLDNYKILFDDVNRDSLPDILYAKYVQRQDTIPYYSTTCSFDIYFYDATTNYETINQINLYRDTLMSVNSIIESSGVSLFKNIDTNNDGFNELVVSYETFYETLWGYTLESTETDGTCLTYHSYPDSLNLKSNNLVTNFSQINDSIYISNALYNSKGDSHASGQWTTSKLSSSTINKFGEVVKEFDLINDISISCSYPVGYWYSKNSSFLTTGHIIDSTMDTQILFQKSFSRDLVCYDGGYVNYLTSGSELTLQNYIAPDSIEEIWTLDITGHNYTNFLYHPLEPGYFFAFEGNSLIQFDGSDGSSYQRNDTLPIGTRSWVEPFNDNLPRLAITNDSTIKLIKFDISTDINDINPNNLPNQFTLWQNYPNPFNPTTMFSYSLPSKGFVKAEVFNILGQNVATLIDQDQTAGEHQINWDASEQSSGIYLFKVSYDNQTKSIKTLLLK